MRNRRDPKVTAVSQRAPYGTTLDPVKPTFPVLSLFSDPLDPKR
jgi:hypothetical protein